MKFVTFLPHTGVIRPRLGVLRGETVIDVNTAYTSLLLASGIRERAYVIADAVLPADLLQFFDSGVAARGALDETLRFVDTDPERFDESSFALREVSLQAPIPRPRTIREFGRFPGHLTADGRSLPDAYFQRPFYWKGNPNSVIGPDTEIVWPSYTERLDYELEIAAVIGRPAINVRPDEALEYIGGYTIFNDVSARDIQGVEAEYRNYWGKSKDFCNVMGPALVTTDELDPSTLSVSVHVNGEQWASADTSDMSSTWPDLVAYCSQDEWLLPGDVFTSGTVTGCSASEHLGMPKSGPILSPGDLLEFNVEGIGTLRNRIGQREAR